MPTPLVIITSNLPFETEVASVYIFTRIESGDRIPSLQLLRELGGRLGVSEDYLATGSDEPPQAAVLVDAEVALRLGEVDAAERGYKAALESARTDRGRGDALSGLGQVEFLRGDPKAAIARFERALEVYGSNGPDHPDVADSLGVSRFTVYNYLGRERSDR